MSEDAILAELKHMRSDFSKMDQRMQGIEGVLKDVAIQTQQINTLDRDVTKLWGIKDECSKDMVEIKKFQAQCPRHTIAHDLDNHRKDVRETLRNQWIAIGILATGLIAVAGWIKISGVA